MKKLLIIFLIVCLTPYILHSAMGRWEKSTKISGNYGFLNSAWDKSQSWNLTINANFIRHSPFSKFIIAPYLEYGQVENMSTHDITHTPNKYTMTFDFTKNVSAFVYWRLMFIPNGPMMSFKKESTGMTDADGNEIVIENKNELQFDSNDMQVESRAAVGKNFSRYFSGELGGLFEKPAAYYYIATGNPDEYTKRKSGDIASTFYIKTNYSKPLGYRTNFFFGLEVRSNKFVIPNVALSYKFGRRISLDINLYEPYDGGESKFVDEKRTVNLTYELFY